MSYHYVFKVFPYTRDSQESHFFFNRTIFHSMEVPVFLPPQLPNHILFTSRCSHYKCNYFKYLHVSFCMNTGFHVYLCKKLIPYITSNCAIFSSSVQFSSVTQLCLTLRPHKIQVLAILLSHGNLEFPFVSQYNRYLFLIIFLICKYYGKYNEHYFICLFVSFY